jgi:hypothetical protein
MIMTLAACGTIAGMDDYWNAANLLEGSIES